MNNKNLISIDIGNTKTSCMIHTKDESKQFSIKQIDQLTHELKLTQENTDCYISNVTKLNISIPFKKVQMQDFFKSHNFLDMKIDYNETLGIDRILCAYYAYKKFKSTTVIDSGSFTTIDKVTDQFKGGFILPGLEVLKKTYLKGEQLKDFNIDAVDSRLPKTSHEAINAGLALSFYKPIQEVIDRYQSQEIILTGGNAELIQKNINCTASIHYIPDLIHKSMNFIHKAKS